MNQPIPGIHHVTAMSSDPQATVDFTTRVLGLKLVKRTVNFDDPGTHHFYFGDALGRPGTLLTFFPWPGTPQGARGTGEVSETALAIPAGSLDAWSRRLADHDVPVATPATRFGERMLAVSGPDGARFELIETAEAPVHSNGETRHAEARHAIGGIHSVTLLVEDPERTESLLQELGFRSVGRERDRHRFQSASGGLASRIDVVAAPGQAHARLGAGSVHHVAFRTKDDGTQADWMRRLARQGLHVTPVQERQYFRSIYFREPGGVLFEIATDPPGMTLDEPADALGLDLKLPPWLEPMRDRIESALPPVVAFEPTR